MKNILYKILMVTLVVGFAACERQEDGLVPARFPTTSFVFDDDFIGMGSDFYFPYSGAKPDVFSVDRTEGFESAASVRIDVPNANDPGGNFAGAIFRVDGPGRDLQDYNALSFYAKASQAATINELGFGQNFEGDQYRAFRTGITLSTNWEKYVIPIPDPSKLTNERGVFQFAAGGIGPLGEEVGYSVWFDEIRFEQIGTIAQPLPQIFGGQELEQSSFDGVSFPVSGVSVIYNVSGTDVPVVAAPSYFDFESSNSSVATVDEFGSINVGSEGTATITASVGPEGNRVEAEGSITINSSGPFNGAPVPPERAEADVVSIFSDAYDNVQVDNYNGFFQFATTQGGAINIAGENLISYTDLNFVSINMFNSPNVDASQMTHVHVDINVQEAVDPSDFLRFQLINNNGPTETSATVNLQDYSPLLENEWVSYDIPLADFTGLAGTNDIDLIFFVSDGTISSIFVDNVYFYREQ